MVRIELLVYAQQPIGAADSTTEGLPAGQDVRLVHPIPRPGEHTSLYGGFEAAAEQVRTAAAQAWRITVCREDTEVLQAQQDAAALLEGLAAQADDQAAQLVVVDVLSLDCRPLAEALERLSHDEPGALQWVVAQPTDDGRYDLATLGLRKLGQREIHIANVPRERLEVARRFLNKIGDYAATTGATIRAGDATTFGWATVRYVRAEHLATFPDDPRRSVPEFIRRVVGDGPDLPGAGVLAVFEPSDDSEDCDWRLGATRVATLADQMLRTAAQCGSDRHTNIPHQQQTAVLCTLARQGEPLAARRVEPETAEESGWVVICRDPDHDHASAEAFSQVPLLELVRRIPTIFSLLAMPPGTGVNIGADEERTILLPDDGR